MRIIFKIGAFLYFALLFYIFFLARRRPHPSLEQGHRVLRLEPLYDKYIYLRYFFFSSAKEQWKFYSDFLGNIFLFIPFACILSIVFNIKSTRKIILISLFTSIAIETIQYILRIGVADIDDVILNTSGACIGVLLLNLLRKSRHPLIHRLLYPV